MDELKKYLPKATLSTVVIAFFLPFLLVKCGEAEMANLSGVQLITGTEIGSEEQAEVIAPNIFAILGFLSAIVGLIVLFTKLVKAEMIALVSSIVGLISLLFLYNAASTEVLESGNGMINIQLGIGFHLALISYLANTVFLGVCTVKKKQPKEVKLVA